MITHHEWIYLDEDTFDGIYAGGEGEDVGIPEGNEKMRKKGSDYRAVIRPQWPWPWILTQCLMVGDINSEVGNVRLLALLYTLDEFGDPNGLLNEFSAVNFTRRFELSTKSLHKWMMIMYPVVGLIQSWFHNPCEVVKDHYSHLLLKCHRRADTTE
jgi:hypothetical protein